MSMIINPYLSNLGGCVDVQGLNLQVGTGTTNIFQYPAYGLFDFSWTSMIWNAAEMAGAKRITGIEIEIGGYTVPYTYNNQTIKLAHLAPATTTFDANPAINWSDMPVSDVTIQSIKLFVLLILIFSRGVQLKTTELTIVLISFQFSLLITLNGIFISRQHV